MKVNLETLKRRYVPTDNNYATINKSFLNELNNPDMYRFFCLSLHRNERYYVRITLGQLAQTTGEQKEALGKFNAILNQIITIKKYSGNKVNIFGYKPRRNLYFIPDIDFDNGFITISKNFIKVDLPVKIKGYYLKLLLIAENNQIPLSKSKLAKLLGMGTAKIDDYNIELFTCGLLIFSSKGIKLTPNSILLDNDIAIRKPEPPRSMKEWLPNVILNGKKVRE